MRATENPDFQRDRQPTITIEDKQPTARSAKTNKSSKQPTNQSKPLTPERQKSENTVQLELGIGLDVITDKEEDEEDAEAESSGDDSSDSAIDDQLIMKFKEIQGTLNDQDDLLGQLKDEIDETRTMHVVLEQQHKFGTAERELKH